jgi:hypothetical protein
MTLGPDKEGNGGNLFALASWAEMPRKPQLYRRKSRYALVCITGTCSTGSSLFLEALGSGNLPFAGIHAFNV